MNRSPSVNTQCFVFDLDGVLANTDARMHLLHDADLFYKDIYDDVPADALRNLMSIVYRHAAIHIVTGRPERTRVATAGWLHRHGFEYSKLTMRPDGDPGTVQDFKVVAVNAIKRSGLRVLGVFEDNPFTAEHLRDRCGVSVVLVDSGHYTRFGQDPKEDRAW